MFNWIYKIFPPSKEKAFELAEYYASLALQYYLKSEESEDIKIENPNAFLFMGNCRITWNGEDILQ